MSKILIIIIASFFINGSFAQTDTKWIEIKKAPIITIKKAKRIKRYKNTPESILSYFYASRIREDEKWLNVTPISRSKKLEYAINKYKDWNFTKFKLVSKRAISPKKIWVKVFFEITYNGKTDSGEDEACLELVDGKWLISTLPS